MFSCTSYDPAGNDGSGSCTGFYATAAAEAGLAASVSGSALAMNAGDILSGIGAVANA